jgi:hypothetical protein
MKNNHHNCSIFFGGIKKQRLCFVNWKTLVNKGSNGEEIGIILMNVIRCNREGR